MKYILILAILIGFLFIPQTNPTADKIDFIVGPQAPITNSWFDQNQLARARVHGEACPEVPPTDWAALDRFVLLNYYDLPLTEYIAYQRTGDPVYLTYARKCA